MSKTIFITGASSGIGLATAKLFFSKGWNVVATMRTPEKDIELRKLDPSRILILRLDLQDLNSISQALEAAIARFSKVDLLLNNAGYGQNGLFESISREQIQQQFDVNLFGLMDMIRAVLPHFRNNGGGGIINVSSGGGLYALPMISVYCASKFALEGFTESLAFELASQNIFVKSVIPHGGVTSTNFSSRPMPATAEGDMTAYRDFVEDTGQSFKNMVAGRSISSHDVAEVIHEAATDGTDRLRYLVGNDTRGFIKARYESKNDEEYTSYMRSFFK
ncbi:short-chain alcohol dehydrogenase [Mycena floridula]|nr:short-chain alcohol dehydrogenase [Mycena floridula]